MRAFIRLELQHADFPLTPAERETYVSAAVEKSQGIFLGVKLMLDEILVGAHTMDELMQVCDTSELPSSSG